MEKSNTRNRTHSIIGGLYPNVEYSVGRLLQNNSQTHVGSLEKFGIFTGFALLYLLTLSHNLSITHDSITYLQAIASGAPVFHANHLLHEHLGTLISKLGSPWLTTQQSLGIAGALTGALVMQVIYSMLRVDLQVNPRTALCAVGVIGFSYGMWYYSIAIEIYIFPLAFLMICLRLLIRNSTRYSTILLCSLLHSAAVLIHQSSVLFGVVPFVAIFCMADTSLPQRFRLFLTYLGLCAVLVGGIYIIVGQHLGKLDDIQTFVLWLSGNAAHSDSWSGLSVKSALLAVVGFVRAVVSFSFLFAIPELTNSLATLFPTNSLSDEIFLTKELKVSHAYALVGATVLLACTLLALAIVSLRQLIKQGLSYQVLLMICWVVPSLIFYTVFDPSNVDFWIAMFALCVIAIAIGGNNAPAYFNKLFFMAAVLVMVTNYAGVINFTNDSRHDFYKQSIDHYAKSMDRTDLLIIADGWPIADHLSYYDKFEFIAVADYYASGQSAAETANILNKNITDRNAIFVHQDIFSLSSHSLNEWGPEFADYLKEVTSHLCAGKTIPGDQFPDLIKVSCLL